jgi:MFS family permease
MTRSAEHPQVPSRPLVGRVLARVGQVITMVASCGFGAVGVLAFPMTVFVVWLTLGATVGGVVLMLCHDQRRRCTAGDAGVLAAASATATVCTCLVLAGLAAVLGALAALVVPLLLAGTAAWVLRHREARGDDAWTVTIPAPSGIESDRAGDAVRALLAAASIRADASTRELCAAWCRSYWLLHDLPPGPHRYQVLRIREDLLDELERRDPAGFDRWLQTHPRAGSDPSRFLSADP